MLKHLSMSISMWSGDLMGITKLQYLVKISFVVGLPSFQKNNDIEVR